MLQSRGIQAEDNTITAAVFVELFLCGPVTLPSAVAPEFLFFRFKAFNEKIGINKVRATFGCEGF